MKYNLNNTTLDSFPLNIIGKIVGFDEFIEDFPIKIIEMGILPGTFFKILHIAPFNGPLYIELGNEDSRLALRKEEARLIFVENI